ncbi:hypothetical protein Tco_1082534 [Tanacetum coccineum]|uniref:Uncharacterized protein n=1 Tax=Tanacetum coccineum TaxID=301880 RepID=A0ABQ5I1Y9_9ASTR
MPYPRFTKVIINYFISKDKSIYMRNKINLHTVRDDTLLGTLKFVSKTEDAQKYGALIPDGMINQDIKDSEAYKTYYDFATRKVAPKKARKFKKVASPSRKLSPIKEAEPAKKAKRVKRHAKKCTTAPTANVVIKDTPAAQVKEALKKSKQDSHMLHASGSGDGVGSQLKGDSQDDKSNDDADNNSDNKDGDSKDDDGNSNAGDSERTDSDSHKDVDPNLNLKEDEEEESHDEEYVRTPDYYVPTNEESREENRESNEEEYADLYGDVNITPKDTKPKKEGKVIVSALEMELSQFRQVNHSAQLLATIKQQNPAIIDDILSTRIGYATQTALQSYTAEFKKNAQEEKHRYFDVIEKSIKGIIKDEKSKPYQAALEHREIYDGLIKSYNLDKDLFLSYGKAYSLKRDREDEDKDEDPPVGSNQGLKKRKTSKDAEPSKGSKSK